MSLKEYNEVKRKLYPTPVTGNQEGAFVKCLLSDYKYLRKTKIFT